MDPKSIHSLYSFNPPPPCSSSSTPRYSYDVFISFRGQDTRKNFTDHLWAALTRAGISTFRHDHELPVGLDMTSELPKAIQESKVSIVVFSRDYASSWWCLEELVKILDCMDTTGQLVLPVYYNVDPFDVRELKGTFACAFARQEMEKVERWRAALTRAADLSGWDLASQRIPFQFIHDPFEFYTSTSTNCPSFWYIKQLGKHICIVILPKPSRSFTAFGFPKYVHKHMCSSSKPIQSCTCSCRPRTYNLHGNAYRRFYLGCPFNSDLKPCQ